MKTIRRLIACLLAAGLLAGNGHSGEGLPASTVDVSKIDFTRSQINDCIKEQKEIFTVQCTLYGVGLGIVVNMAMHDTGRRYTAISAVIGGIIGGGIGYLVGSIHGPIICNDKYRQP